MKLLLLSEGEHEMLEAMLTVAWDEGYVSEECRRLRVRVEHAITTRVPPKIKAGTGKPQHRGPHRRILQVLTTEHGIDALMLECGHVVARHHRLGHTAVYCEACRHCQPLDEAP